MSPLPLIDLPPAEDSAVSALPGTDRKNVANQDMGSADLLDFTTPPKPLLPFEYRSPNGHPVQLRGLPGPGGLDRPHHPKPQARMIDSAIPPILDRLLITIDQRRIKTTQIEAIHPRRFDLLKSQLDTGWFSRTGPPLNAAIAPATGRHRLDFTIFQETHFRGWPH